MLSVFEARAINIMAKLQNLAKRMERYGAVSLSEYRAHPANVHDTEAWNAYVLQIVYADECIPDDDDDHLVYEHVMEGHEQFYTNMDVYYVKPIDDEEGFLHVNIRVADGSLLSFVIGHDGLIETLDIPYIANNIEEDTTDDSE